MPNQIAPASANTTPLNSGICGARVEVSPGLRVHDHLRAQLGQQRPDLQNAEAKCTALWGATFGAQALACPDDIWVLPTRHPQNTRAAVQGKHGHHKVLRAAIQLRRHFNEAKRRVSCRTPQDETIWLAHYKLTARALIMKRRRVINFGKKTNGVTIGSERYFVIIDQYSCLPYPKAEMHSYQSWNIKCAT